MGKTSGHVYDFVSNVKNMGELSDIRIEKVYDEKSGKDMWNVTGGMYKNGFHMAPLYSYKLKKKD